MKKKRTRKCSWRNLIGIVSGKLILQIFHQQLCANTSELMKNAKILMLKLNLMAAKKSSYAAHNIFWVLHASNKFYFDYFRLIWLSESFSLISGNHKKL